MKNKIQKSSISRKTLSMLDSSMKNLANKKASKPIDLKILKKELNQKN